MRCIHRERRCKPACFRPVPQLVRRVDQGSRAEVTAYLPTLKQLQYLVALKDHGHFGKAADACFVTQSTLSAGLRELETLFGVTSSPGTDPSALVDVIITTGADTPALTPPPAP